MSATKALNNGIGIETIRRCSGIGNVPVVVVVVVVKVDIVV